MGANLQVLSYKLIENLSSSAKITKILDLVKLGDVVMFEGRLSSEEELDLTTKALQSVSGKFTGVEIAFLGSTGTGLLEKLKHNIVKVVSGRSLGITVIGPSKIIQEIKMDPNNLEILLKK